jgi:hypothetical protein
MEIAHSVILPKYPGKSSQNRDGAKLAGDLMQQMQQDDCSFKLSRRVAPVNSCRLWCTPGCGQKKAAECEFRRLESCAPDPV